MRLLLLATLASLFCGCTTVAGNGTPGTENREVAQFTALRNEINVPVILTNGQQQQVRVDCDANLVEKILTNVVDGELVVTLPNNVSIAPSDDCAVRVSAPSVNAIANLGSGGIQVIGTHALRSIVDEGSGAIDIEAVATAELDIESLGSGSTSIATLTASLTRVDIEGSGSVAIDTGATNTLNATLLGSGGLDAAQLASQVATLDLQGSGEANVRCTDTVTTSVSGSGSATIFGDPTNRNHTVTGSGRVTYPR
jgi:hypothetical protein